jgi:hypothetical protein
LPRVRAAADPALRPQVLAALKAVSRHQSNSDVAENLIGMYAALGENSALLQGLATFCAAVPVACNNLAINPFFTALRADPGFQKLVKQYNTVTVQWHGSSRAAADPAFGRCESHRRRRDSLCSSRPASEW